MTDTSPRPVKFIPCRSADGRGDECGAAVLDTDADRRRHRAWHAQDVKVKNALRDALRDRDTQIRDLKQLIVDARRDIDGIEIPEQAPPVELSEDGWSEDDEPDTTDLDDDDDPRSHYLDDNDDDNQAFLPRVDPLTGLPR